MILNPVTVQSGIKLPELENPGAAGDLLTGKQLIDAEGKVLTGTMPSLGAQTITPGTASKTIAAGRYLAGTQTIQGDANLAASNIKSGVSIFGVAGSYEGASAMITDVVADGSSLLSVPCAFSPSFVAVFPATKTMVASLVYMFIGDCVHLKFSDVSFDSSGNGGRNTYMDWANQNSEAYASASWYWTGTTLRLWHATGLGNVTWAPQGTTMRVMVG